MSDDTTESDDVTTIDELKAAVDRLEDSDEELREWLRERNEAQLLNRVTKPKQYGGSGVGKITIKVSKPGRACYYTIRGGNLYLSTSHPNTNGISIVHAPKANGSLLRRAVEYYPVFLKRLVDRVNESATRFEAALPDDPVPDVELDDPEAEA